jgi:hypothetical protein
MKYAINTSKNMENKDFAVFILTHGRPNGVMTHKTLERCGYTGPIYFIVDNEDNTIDEYVKNFGTDHVVVFDKKATADNVDEGNNFDNRKVIIHARNACFDIAEQLGLTYFLQLDDDYYEFDYKFQGTKGLVMPKSIDDIFDKTINFYKSTAALSIAFSQTGDFIGGVDNGKGSYRFNKRKAMNSFFCSIHRRFQFIGQLNEDVNTYTTLGSRGNLFLTIPVLAINQKDTQKQKGGMTDAYVLSGTYVKSFHTVIMQPSSVSISMMNANHKRIHHKISWANTTPMIIDERHKK